jgi:hypothetical protein
MNYTTSALWQRIALPLSIFILITTSINRAHSQNTYCISRSNAPWSEWIANVQLANLNNASDKTRDPNFVGYSDWTDKTITVSNGLTYPLSITPGLSFAGYQTNLFLRAWIDYNKNGIYEDTEKVLEQNSNGIKAVQNITIPSSVVLGTVRMRVSLKKDAYPTACETFTAGEVEDYMVVIQNGNNDPCATDVTQPILQNCPQNITVNTTGTTTIVNWNPVTATDNCTMPPLVTSNYANGQNFQIGTTSVIFSASDTKNNTSTCSFNINVTNTTQSSNTCISKSNNPWNEWIANVKFANLDNSSGPTRNDRYVVGYSDWKDKQITVVKGLPYTLTITPGLLTPDYTTGLNYVVWLDFNNNSIFENTEIVIFNPTFRTPVTSF